MAKSKDRANLVLTAEPECSSVALGRTALPIKEQYTCDGHPMGPECLAYPL